MSTNVVTSEHLAALALEVWRASGERSEVRRTRLVEHYAETYFGPRIRKWSHEITDLVDLAHLITRQRTRIDELVYPS